LNTGSNVVCFDEALRRGDWMNRRNPILRSYFLHLFLLLLLASLAPPAGAWEREPNSVFAERRAKLIAAVGAPVVIFGYTGNEESNPSYVFMQEENFYYLTGHNEEGAALLLVPESAAQKGWTGAREILYLPPRDLAHEKWNGPRMGPDDSGIKEKTGFADVETFAKLHDAVVALTKTFPEIYSELPGPHDEGYPHAENWSKWIKEAAPQAVLKDVSPAVGTLRAIKSPGELALIQKAIDPSIDAQFAAMKMMHSGLYEYQVAAKMVEIHAYAGCETEAYSPIVGSGIDSTVLHYNKLDRKIDGGEIVLMDVGGQYSGYASDITRTVPADGKFTPRQREIYEIVLGAQNAALAAVKPGMMMTGQGSNSLQKIAMEYIDSHGKDKEGRSLGRYYIHGLSHHVGLNVHDPSGPPRPLEPGMVITIEPGIYIPEENLGVRIEDNVLITETGYKLLSERLPRDPAEIEKIMAQAASQRAKASEKGDD
jgi:Xaa-Pro aminopeptidase